MDTKDKGEWDVHGVLRDVATICQIKDGIARPSEALPRRAPGHWQTENYRLGFFLALSQRR